MGEGRKLRPHPGVRERERAYFGLKGCLAVFDPVMTSFTAGLWASAR